MTYNQPVKTGVLLGLFRTRSTSDARRVRLAGRGTIERLQGVIMSQGEILYEESENYPMFVLQGEE